MMETRGGMSIESQGDVVVISGTIDEAAELAGLLDRARSGRLVLDLGGVVFIHALRVPDWIRLLTAAQRAGTDVELRRVAAPLVHQLNMIVATRGAARVTSFFAPYACDACGHEEARVIDAVAHAAQLVRLEAPAMTCPACGVAMVFNDFPERYFSFLAV